MLGPETGTNYDTSRDASEKRIALVHRVLIPDDDYPKEYAILVTNLRSIFIRQPKTRKSFVLRYEMMIGTALVTDVAPMTFEDYEQTSIETLASDSSNLTVTHGAVTALRMKADRIRWRRRDFFVKMVMNRQREVFQVYNFEMRYQSQTGEEATFRFYAVPLGAYFKPRRLVQNRETVLREYAQDILGLYQGILPIQRVLSDVTPAY